jgi:hypothetical protein
MKALHLSPASASSPSFALISVLALVSLAALTATAFLASARLERQATMPLTQTTILEMALDAGAECAKEVIDAPLSHFNHVTTYWRGTNATDWTNELGYLLNGSPRKTSSSLNNRTSTIINYACCFSTATFTNLGTNASELIVMTNDISSQGSFLSEMSANMFNQTNFAAGQFTNISLLGNQTSPPVGWVYIKQDVRVKLGSTNTTNVPVARFAFYVQDLSSMIDAERMGGFTNGTPYRESTALPANYIQGTNPAEISLTNLTGTALTNYANATNFTSTNNRIKYLAPGMLVLSNVGGINPNDLRYVTAGLIHWTNAYQRIPMGLGYSLSWANKVLLDGNAINNNPAVTLTNITNWISTNLPTFTNRAGGMNGSNYLLTLAANIIGYADTDSRATSTNIGVTNIVGFDSYPMLTQIFDQFVCTQTGPVPPVITVNTYLQFWNPSSISSPTTTNTLLYDFADTIYQVTFTSTIATTNVTPASASRLTTLVTTNIVIPPLPANSGFITNITTVTGYSIPNSFTPTAPMTWANFAKVWLNTNPAVPLPASKTNSLAIQVGGTNYLRMKNGYYRMGLSLTNNETNWLGVVLGLKGQGATGIAGTSRLLADPRMLNYISLQSGVSSYSNSYWQGYPAETTSANLWGNPVLWPDGTNSTGDCPSRGTNYAVTTTPPLGVFTIPDPAPCKLSNQGSYTNICELGSIFDPIQWAPPTTTTNYANCNITTNAGSIWTTNDLYGGGSTLRIGRPEHSAFAFTNVAGSTVAIPNMQRSAAALLDLFCTTLQFDESGKINLNTAPAPVLRALAGGIYLRSDATLPNGNNFSVPPAMAEAFAQGVMRFRAKYPFHSPSQLAFIGTDPNWPNTNTWPSGAVFGNKDTIFLTSSAPGNTSGASATMGVTGWNDQAAEEWFSKIFNLSTTYSRNFRVYVIAQKATNEGTVNKGVGPVVRKYYNVITRCNKDGQNDVPPATFSTRPTLEAPY